MRSPPLASDLIAKADKELIKMRDLSKQLEMQAMGVERFSSRDESLIFAIDNKLYSYTPTSSKVNSIATNLEYYSFNPKLLRLLRFSDGFKIFFRERSPNSWLQAFVTNGSGVETRRLSSTFFQQFEGVIDVNNVLFADFASAHDYFLSEEGFNEYTSILSKGKKPEALEGHSAISFSMNFEKTAQIFFSNHAFSRGWRWHFEELPFGTMLFSDKVGEPFILLPSTKALEHQIFTPLNHLIVKGLKFEPNEPCFNACFGWNNEAFLATKHGIFRHSLEKLGVARQNIPVNLKENTLDSIGSIYSAHESTFVRCLRFQKNDYLAFMADSASKELFVLDLATQKLDVKEIPFERKETLPVSSTVVPASLGFNLDAVMIDFEQ